jgi:hypothetical protein
LGFLFEVEFELQAQVVEEAEAGGDFLILLVSRAGLEPGNLCSKVVPAHPSGETRFPHPCPHLRI